MNKNIWYLFLTLVLAIYQSLQSMQTHIIPTLSQTKQLYTLYRSAQRYISGYTKQEKKLLTETAESLFPKGCNISHIFEPQKETFITNRGMISTYCSGWHHDFQYTLLHHHSYHKQKIKILNFQPDIQGAYSMTWKLPSTTEKTSTFFPAEWPRVYVLTQIYVALQNKEPEMEQPHRYNEVVIHLGSTDDGLPIRIIMNHAGAIITAYPVIIV